MSSIRTRLIIPILGALVAVPLLAGCSGDQISQVVSNVASQAGGANVDVNPTGVPSGFPAGIPLIAGSVSGGLSVGVAQGQGWTVKVNPVNPSTALASIIDQMKAAGFTTSFSGNANGYGVATFENGTYNVIVTTTSASATYVVTKLP